LAARRDHERVEFGLSAQWLSPRATGGTNISLHGEQTPIGIYSRGKKIIATGSKVQEKNCLQTYVLNKKIEASIFSICH
jgi:hypothetical protein